MPDDVKQANNTASSPDIVVTPKGEAIPVPKGASGPANVINPSGNVTGFSYTGGNGGANGNFFGVRIMDPTVPKGNVPGYPNGYVKYVDAFNGGVDYLTGRTLPNKISHMRLK